MTEPQWWQRMTDAVSRSTGVFLRDVGRGLLDVSHNMLALVGLVVVSAAIFLAGRADLRASIEQQAYGWLQARLAPQDGADAGDDTEDVQMPEDPGTTSLANAMAIDPKTLSRQQVVVTNWLARRYKVAPEPVARLVQEAWHVGQRTGMDPTLILAVVAVESSFNPFAQSAVGAQGLMQVMTRVHNQKYQAFGGALTAFDPVTNLRVGVQVLRECISRAGGVEAGLRYYVGAANADNDGGYAGRVLAEQDKLRRVAAGQKISVNAQNAVAAATAPPAPASHADLNAAPAPAKSEPPVGHLQDKNDHVALVTG
ncbi:lytic transglycosylase domain-containing protein [Ideonella benzenivorans]|uniref:lytic transglycosylase domain-containing protein n=1 Tax=Ideonella benzenivorans TaxID=2831643 RepID=UPI001CED2B91|nr:lytic transglycosylase domain-containing protein [Ideonella benzenivorans]